MTASLPPFAVGQFKDVLILTVLLPDLNHSNAGWLKEQILEFVARYQPQRLLINLCNVQDVDRLGVGLLISLNTQLKSQLSLSFSGVSAELESRLQALYLRHAFKIADPSWHCLLCGQCECVHLPEWDRLMNQFRLESEDLATAHFPPLHELTHYYTTASEQQLDLIIAAFEQDPRYQALEFERERKAFWQQVRNYTGVGLLSGVFVFGALFLILVTLNSQWLQALEQGKNWLQRPKIDQQKQRRLQAHELVDKFDKDGDGLVTQEDWPYLSSSEKMTLINHGFHERKSRSLGK